MRLPRFLTLLCVLSIAPFGIAACGDDDDDGNGGDTGGGAEGGSVTIYSSLPLQGASRPQTTAMVKGIQLALKEVGNKAGSITIKYVSRDDSTAQAGEWVAEQEQANARKAAQDESTAVYLGPFNSGAAQVSIPILNEANIPQISPANTYVGLTKNEPGVAEGEPEKYYPTQRRTYSRIIPRDSIQGAALVSLMQEDKCGNVYITNDKDTYGQGLATNVETAAKEAGLEVLGNDGIDVKAANQRSLASKIERAGAECFFFGGITSAGAKPLYKDVAAVSADIKMYGGDGVCESGFTDPKEDGVGPAVTKRFKCTVGTPPRDKFPPAGQEFFKTFAAEYGDKTPDPYAIYGYEAMRLAVDAIERAGSTDREAILKALFETADRESVLGTYSIDEDGDTTLTDISVYEIENNEPVAKRLIKGEI